ncbi:MAG: hypothetical protein GTO12_07170 [Proteobacteria bacterium]|nr:hypothetical protein [Pseudomonadota bacterium]
MRKKKIAGQIYYYLVESYLKEGRVKQRVLKYLGKEIPKKYVSEYQKRGPRVAPETRVPHSAGPANHGEAKGGRHGRKKAWKVLSD